jgi:hypothetical protein
MVFGRFKGTATRVREGIAKAESKLDKALEARAASAKASRAKWDRRKQLVGEITGRGGKGKKSQIRGRAPPKTSRKPGFLSGSTGFPGVAASNPWNLQSSSSPFSTGPKADAPKKKRTIRVTIDE